MVQQSQIVMYLAESFILSNYSQGIAYTAPNMQLSCCIPSLSVVVTTRLVGEREKLGFIM